jgi:hypothetical protein
MARGFESKDVEFQQAEAAREKTARPPLSEAEREAVARRQTLELSLARARSELAAARSDTHRRMLERAIAALEAQVQSER